MILPSYCLYTDGQVFIKRKESYIAITDGTGDAICFALIGFKTIRITEGTAILKALEYLREHNITNATIYTDSLDWVGITNGDHRINIRPKHKEAFELANRIVSLKEELFTNIVWKRRTFNLAGHFLGEVWRTKKEKRPKLLIVPLSSEETETQA